MSVFIIAEAGVNHNGNLNTAFLLVHAAKDAGADAVKFQTFWGFPKFQHLELSKDDFVRVKQCCDDLHIEFMATPDTIEAVDFLAELGMRTWKIGSRNVTNYPFLERLGRLGRQTLLSTGMATLSEIKAAYWLLTSCTDCTIHEFPYKTWWHGPDTRHVSIPVKRQMVCVLYCISEYPASIGTINLNVIKKWQEREFNFVGLSDHTLGIHIPIAAVAMGASVIEKHFTLDKTQEGADHHMSLEPYELAEMVRCIRDVETAMGDGVKRPTEYELKVRNKLRNYEDCR